MLDKLNLPEQIAKLSPQQRESLKQKLQHLHKLDKPSKAIKQNNSLSFSQERIWFLKQLEPENPVYNRSTNIRLTGKLNISALEQSINEIIHRHEVLRTSFISQDGRPQLVITPQLTITLPSIDFSHLADNQKQESLEKLAVEEAQKPFDLRKIPLLRAKLVRLSEQQHILLLTIHHIVFDGWSAGVFFKELGLLYEAFCQSKPSPLPPLSIQYQDFAQAQKEQIKGEKLSLQLNYWKKQLAGELPVLQLPTDYPRQKERTWHGASYNLTLSKSLTDSLKHLSQKEGVTLFMTLLAAFQVLLYRYTSQEDILVGSPIAGRDNLEIENLIGVFINNLVFRTQLSGDLSFQQLLTQVRQIALEAYANKDVPFEKLVEELQPQRDLSITPIFQVFFQLRSFPQHKLGLKELSFDKFEVDTGIAPFDLTLDITQIATGLVCKFQYNTGLFAQATIAKLARHFQSLLAGIVENSQQKISHLPLLTQREKQQILIDWNNTKADYPQDKCIHQLFEEQVAKTPNAVAVVFEEQQLTYQELNEKANQLAHYLQKLGVKSEILVGLCIERSLEMVIGLLGILKSGAAYVPIDPSYPHERIAHIFEHSQLSILLTQQSLTSKLILNHAKIVDLDRDWDLIKLENPHNPNSFVTSQHLAYAIYTSGSTGKPKGVMISHRALVNYMSWMQKEFPLGTKDKILQKTPFCFDASVWEFYGCLLVGGQLVMARPEGHQDPHYLIKTINQHKITVVQFVPTLLEMLLEQETFGSCKSLKRVFCGGELLRLNLVEKFSQIQGSELINLYGPTEATIYASYFRCCQRRENQRIPIGRPIANTKILVLDKNLQLNPVGVPGELHIGGESLARGYLHASDLTAEKFITNPFGEGRLYKTGDQGRYLADGNIEFLGRMDNQVKIRGFRIELGEIETNLNQHPNIKDTVVMVRENHQGDPYLTAYLMAKNEQTQRKELRQFLAQKLPEYMIPNAMVFLDAFPLTPNGKINRQALPEPDWQTNRENEFIAPRNQIERKLAGIWQNILGIEKVGINDDFFVLGGHSLIAVQMLYQIQKEFAVELSLRYLFEHSTIKNLALLITGEQQNQRLKTQTPNQQQSLPQIKANYQDKYLPFSLNDIQEAYWVGRSTNIELGNVSTHDYMEVDTIDLDLARFEQAWQKLIERHDMLRAIILDDGRQQILPQIPPYEIKVLDLEDQPSEIVESKLAEIRENLSHEVLECDRPPLFKITATNLGKGKIRLHFSRDALILDGWSVRLLFQEWYQLYHYPGTELPPLEISFRDYILAVQSLKESPQYKKAKNYWRQRLESLPPREILLKLASPCHERG